MPRAEKNICPPEYQARLTDVGGMNRYDEPNFVLVWAQGGDQRGYTRTGGCWTVDEASVVGYRWLNLGSNQPCWSLLQWHDAIEYGTPEIYYMQNYDETTNLQYLGEYPYSGRYEGLYNLGYLEREQDKMVYHAMPLCARLIDEMLPVIMAAKFVSLEKKKAFHEDMKERDERSKLSEIERSMRDAALPFRGNAISYVRQGIRTPAVDKKVQEMQKNWNELVKVAQQLRKGVWQSSTDPFQDYRKQK
jgi:hypothetical protein